MSKATCVSLQDDVRDYLDKLAEQEKRSLAFVTNQLLTEAIQGREKSKDKKGGNS